MEIIHAGKAPVQKQEWPLGCAFTCSHCRCEFRVQPGDKFEQETEKRLGGESTLKIACPTCGATLVFKRSEYIAFGLKG